MFGLDIIDFLAFGILFLFDFKKFCSYSINKFVFVFALFDDEYSDFVVYL